MIDFHNRPSNKTNRGHINICQFTWLNQKKNRNQQPDRKRSHQPHICTFRRTRITEPTSAHGHTSTHPLSSTFVWLRASRSNVKYNVPNVDRFLFNYSCNYRFIAKCPDPRSLVGSFVIRCAQKLSWNVLYLFQWRRQRWRRWWWCRYISYASRDQRPGTR